MTTTESSRAPAHGVHVAHAAETTRALVTRLFERDGKLDFAVRLWDSQTLPAADNAPRFTLVLTHPGALRRMFFPPGELTLAEAFLRGDFDVEGDMIAAAGLGAALERLAPKDWLQSARQVLSLPTSDPPQVYKTGRQRVQLRGATHSRARDRAAVIYHYDTGNDFYRLFLGQWMAYSCAYFETADADLDSAQAAKFEHICRKLRLQPGERLLDIGCGWGGLVVYAAEKYGVQATGVTLSEPQAAFANDWIARAGLSEGARVEVQDYRELEPTQPYDKVVSVGMFEHVGRERLPEYFAAAFHALRPGGLFLNHGIAAQTTQSPNWFERTFLQRGQFTQCYIFPDGELVPVSAALTIAEQTGFEVRDVESLREHYALTLRHWVRNLEARRAEAVAAADERTYRAWRLYMAASAYGFETGQINVFQALLSKSEKGAAEVPLTRADLYR